MSVDRDMDILYKDRACIFDSLWVAEAWARIQWRETYIAYERPGCARFMKASRLLSFIHKD